MGVAELPVYPFGADASGVGQPSAIPPEGERSALSHEGSGEDAARSLSVLLVDDDVPSRLVAVVNLEAEGFRVTVAEMGREALDLAAADPPDLVLLDVMLPDLGGFEVAEQLREVPIVFLSALAAPLDLERGRRAGAIDYVTKPFDPTELAARLRQDLQEFERSGSADQVWQMRFGRWLRPTEYEP